MPFSYSVPCPALDLPAEGRQTRRSLRSSEKWQNCTETIQAKTPLISQIPGSPCSTFSGQALPGELPPSELLHLSAAPSSFVACGRPRQDVNVGRIRSPYSRPLVPLVPRLMNPPPPLPPLPGPVSLPPLPPPSPDHTGSGPHWVDEYSLIIRCWIRCDSEASVPPIPAIIIRLGLLPM